MCCTFEMKSNENTISSPHISSKTCSSNVSCWFPLSTESNVLMIKQQYHYKNQMNNHCVNELYLKKISFLMLILFHYERENVFQFHFINQTFIIYTVLYPVCTCLCRSMHSLTSMHTVWFNEIYLSPSSYIGTHTHTYPTPPETEPLSLSWIKWAVFVSSKQRVFYKLLISAKSLRIKLCHLKEIWSASLG